MMMSEIHTRISLPLDDGFLRRECPLCHREFKILLEEHELVDLAQRGLDSFMINQEGESSNDEEEDTNQYFCPYCGQEASDDGWWTQEQLAYIGIYAKNIMAKLVNENFIRPLKKTFRSQKSGLVSFRFEGKEMKQQEPWISPESDDMEVFKLPCCERKMKIEENWPGTVHCYFCGFAHKK